MKEQQGGGGPICIQPISEKLFFALKARTTTTLLMMYGVPMDTSAAALIAREAAGKAGVVTRQCSIHLELIVWVATYPLREGVTFSELSFLIITADGVTDPDRRAVEKEFGLLETVEARERFAGFKVVVTRNTNLPLYYKTPGDLLENTMQVTRVARGERVGAVQVVEALRGERPEVRSKIISYYGCDGLHLDIVWEGVRMSLLLATRRKIAGSADVPEVAAGDPGYRKRAMREHLRPEIASPLGPLAIGTCRKAVLSNGAEVRGIVP